ncbi:alkaline phosphatase family protein [Conexibacter sp. DBS9H8]|uniref:alkaline phosphatase family protein n=1 Tax=Conexibacter sp. DBS9H8 TaxID=2937801 RepID=UPI00200DA0A9|nr:alkaline phosphatase family protein [Conexibacter sp. DBS9H8]
MPSSRREFLTAGGLAAASLAGLSADPALARSRRRARLWATPELTDPRTDQLEALRVLGRTTLRQPDSRPYMALPEGVDTMPEIEHVVLVMMENHSYDNFLGMLGRGPFERARGDGFTLAADGYPANANPQADGAPLRAFVMPTTCQLDGKPSQEWEASHIQYAQGTNRGFVISPSGPVAMGYWTPAQLPFTYALAGTFPIGDRYFCSLLGQTDPNRRFLFAATSCGMTDDIPDPSQDAAFALSPKNGTIFNRLSQVGISWTEYAVQTTTTGISSNLYPADDYRYDSTNVKPFSAFLSDAASGSLPSFSFLDPNYGTQSQENPQNIVVGEAFLRSVVEAVGTSPKWRQTLLIINYDEHGGYYDHVPPPAALAPDGDPPIVNSGESVYDGFRRYGFRVPCIVVSPYAKRDYVSHVVYDHTSVLAFLERKWNLPAMTLRDANANDLTDFLDLPALAAQAPTFPEFPALAPSGDTPAAQVCQTAGPGTVPVPTPSPLPLQVRIGAARVDRPRNALLVPVALSRAGQGPVSVELWHHGRRVARRTAAGLSVTPREVPLRVRGHVPTPGEYTVIARHGRAVLGRRGVHVPG